MKEIILKGLDEKIYYDECENGLKIYIWKKESPLGSYDVEAFLAAPIWDGRTFWEAEQEMEWVDD